MIFLALIFFSTSTPEYCISHTYDTKLTLDIPSEEVFCAIVRDQPVFNNSFIEEFINIRYVNLPDTESLDSRSFQFLMLDMVILPKVTTIKSDTFAGSVLSNSVSIPMITEIVESAFFDQSLITIDISNVQTIKSNAFEKCSSLTRIAVNNLTSVGDFAFSECSNLVYVELSNVQHIGDSAFAGCSLNENKNLYLHSLESAGICCFDHCAGIVSVSLTVLKVIPTSMFCECSLLVKVVAMEAIEIQESAFISCQNLRIIRIPKVESIYEYAFSGCKSLRELISNCKKVEVNAFKNCNISLTMDSLVDVPEKLFQGSKLSHGSFASLTEVADQMFYQTPIVSLNIPKVTKVGVESFFGCVWLSKLTIGKLQTVGDTSFKACTSISNIDLSDCISIGKEAFSRCDGLISVNLRSLEKLSESAFGECKNLETVELTKLKSIDSKAFDQCKSLKVVRGPEVAIISEQVFYGCTNLSDVSFDKLTNLGSYAFRQCESLTSVSFPLLANVSNGVFDSCYKLEMIEFPLLTKFDGTYHFLGCKKLREVYLPNLQEIKNDLFGKLNIEIIDIRRVKELPSQIFKDSNTLSTINIDGVQILNDASFMNCSQLKELSLPSLTTLKGNNIFRGSKSLEIIKLPSLEICISSESNFKDCDSLSRVEFGCKAPSGFELDAFEDSPQDVEMIIPSQECLEQGGWPYKEIEGKIYCYGALVVISGSETSSDFFVSSEVESSSQTQTDSETSSESYESSFSSTSEFSTSSNPETSTDHDDEGNRHNKGAIVITCCVIAFVVFAAVAFIILLVAKKKKLKNDDSIIESLIVT